MDHPFGKSLQLNPENISYGYETFSRFSVETVYLNGKRKNEYHLKAEGDLTNEQLLIVLKKQLQRDCEVGFVDRTGIITLEYPIYIIVTNPILVDEMHNIFIDVEQIINKE